MDKLFKFDLQMFAETETEEEKKKRVSDLLKDPDVQALLAGARQQEKDKLYADVNESKELKKEIEAIKADNAKTKREKDEAIAKAKQEERDKLIAAATAEEKIALFKKEADEAIAAARSLSDRQYQEMQAELKAERIERKREKILHKHGLSEAMAKLVTGDSEEEIEEKALLIAGAVKTAREEALGKKEETKTTVEETEEEKKTDKRFPPTNSGKITVDDNKKLGTYEGLVDASKDPVSFAKNRESLLAAAKADAKRVFDANPI